MSVSEFSSTFDRSFAIHSAISKAVREMNGSGLPIKVSDVTKHLRAETPISRESELTDAIINAAKDAGTSIVISEPSK